MLMNTVECLNYITSHSAKKLGIGAEAELLESTSARGFRLYISPAEKYISRTHAWQKIGCFAVGVSHFSVGGYLPLRHWRVAIFKSTSRTLNKEFSENGFSMASLMRFTFALRNKREI